MDEYYHAGLCSSDDEDDSLAGVLNLVDDVQSRRLLECSFFLRFQDELWISCFELLPVC